MAPQQVPWGTITRPLDNETFRKAWISGRRLYFDDSEYDFVQIAHCMGTLDVVVSVLDEDSKGDYRFDCMAFKDPFGIPDFFLGHVSGLIMVESPQEREERWKRVVILPEAASTTRIAL